MGVAKILTLCLTDNGVPIRIEEITEEEEKRIDKSKLYYGELRYIKDNKHIRAKDIYMYGEIDVDNDDDLDLIERFNLVPKKGGWVYSNFDYDAGTFTTIERKNKGYTTFNPIDWFLYNHCMIGKPKRIIVYANNILKVK